MEAKEILNGMSKGLWEIKHKSTIHTPDGKIADINHSSLPREVDYANAHAITTAVNSTYAMGYDPIKMDEMVRLLDEISSNSKFVKHFTPDYQLKIVNLLNSARI